MKKSRLLALRRMLADHRAGLDGNTTKDDYARVVADLLDEVERLQSKTPDQAWTEYP